MNEEIKNLIRDIRNNVKAEKKDKYDTLEVQIGQLEKLMTTLESMDGLLSGQIIIGERVRLDTLDPEDENEAEFGTVIGFADGGAFLIRPETGEYSDTETGLWYSGDTVYKIND
jgi:hypothetical protein